VGCREGLSAHSRTESASLTGSFSANQRKQADTANVIVAVVSATGALGSAQMQPTPPRFEVDPFWPKPLPNRWLMGQAAGGSVDRQDHIWVVQRPRTLSEDEKGATLTPPRNECCVPAPSVMEFDLEGNLLQAWGGPGQGYRWPENEHGITVDAQDNVWLAGNGPEDGIILKLTRDGRHVMTIGQPGVVGNDSDTAYMNRPSNVAVDIAASEIFVADGYGNHRVIVFDTRTGAYKRHWAPMAGRRVTHR